MINKIKYNRAIFIPDIHVPFQDDDAIRAIIAFARWWKPKTSFYMGDVVDFYAVSHFLRDPERKSKLQNEIDQTVQVMDRINQALGKSEKYLLRGNHEARLQKYLWAKAEEIAGLRSLKIEKLLDLERMNVEYIPDGRTNFHGIIVKHGDIVRKFSGFTGKGEFESSGMSGVSVHTHRLALYRQTNEAGNFVWMECGCLCHLGAEYLDGKIPNWQEGFGIGYFKEGSNHYHLETVPIVDGRAVYGGYEFY